MVAHVVRPAGSASYGAHELKSVARAYMVRAVVAGSGFWVLFFFLTLVASVYLFRHPQEIRLPPRVSVLLPVPPPLAEDYTPRPEIPPIAPPKRGIPIPVPFEPEFLDRIEPPQAPPGPRYGSTTGEDKVPPIAPSSVGEEDVIPDRNLPPDVDEFPEAITKVLPVYSEFARDAGIEGTVVVRVLVGKDGRVRDAIVEPTGSLPLLDHEALKAARQWVFKPAMTHNHPVAVWVTIPMRFTLH